jgi:hypothetical protein
VARLTAVFALVLLAIALAGWFGVTPLRSADVVTSSELLTRRGESRVRLVGAALDWERRVYRVESGEGARFFASDPRTPTIVHGAEQLVRDAERLVGTRVRLMSGGFEPGWVFFHRTVRGGSRRGASPAALFAAHVGVGGWQIADVAAITHVPRHVAPGTARKSAIRLVPSSRSQSTRTRMAASPASSAGTLVILSEEVRSVGEARAREFLARREHVGLLTHGAAPWAPDDQVLDALWTHVTEAERPAARYTLVTVPRVRERTLEVWVPVADTRDRLWVALRDDRPPAGTLTGTYRRFKSVEEFGEVTQSERTRRAEGVLRVESRAR